MCASILPTFAHGSTFNLSFFSELRPFCLMQTHLQDRQMMFGSLNPLHPACSCGSMVQQHSGYAEKTTGCFSQPAQSAPHRESRAQERAQPLGCWQWQSHCSSHSNLLKLLESRVLHGFDVWLFSPCCSPFSEMFCSGSLWRLLCSFVPLGVF